MLLYSLSSHMPWVLPIEQIHMWLYPLPDGNTRNISSSPTTVASTATLHLAKSKWRQDNHLRQEITGASLCCHRMLSPFGWNHHTPTLSLPIPSQLPPKPCSVLAHTPTYFLLPSSSAKSHLCNSTSHFRGHHKVLWAREDNKSGQC